MSNCGNIIMWVFSEGPKFRYSVRFGNQKSIQPTFDSAVETDTRKKIDAYLWYEMLTDSFVFSTQYKFLICSSCNVYDLINFLLLFL